MLRSQFLRSSMWCVCDINKIVMTDFVDPSWSLACVCVNCSGLTKCYQCDERIIYSVEPFKIDIV